MVGGGSCVGWGGEGGEAGVDGDSAGPGAADGPGGAVEVMSVADRAAIGLVVGEGVSVEHERSAAEAAYGDEPWGWVFVEGAVVDDGD